MGTTSYTPVVVETTTPEGEPTTTTIYEKKTTTEKFTTPVKETTSPVVETTPVTVVDTTPVTSYVSTTVIGTTSEIPSHSTTVVSTLAPTTEEVEATTPEDHVTSTTMVSTTAPVSTTTTEVIESTTTVTEKPEPTTTTPGKICSEPMEIEDIFGIPTTVVPRFTASSNEPKGDVGRIDSTEPWTPSEDDLADQDAWIKIEFDEPVYIYGLIVRGGGSESGKFVTKITVDYQLSEDDDFTPVTPSDEDESFPANSDENTPSTVTFPEDEPVLVTVIRVHPVEWVGDEPAIRVGLLGCYKLIETTTTVQKTEIVSTTSKPVVETTTTVTVTSST